MERRNKGEKRLDERKIALKSLLPERVLCSRGWGRVYRDLKRGKYGQPYSWVTACFEVGRPRPVMGDGVVSP